MENSPPGIQTILLGAGPSGFVVLGMVGKNSDGVALAGGFSAKAKELFKTRITKAKRIFMEWLSFFFTASVPI
jgi:hypothetical protein